MKRKNGPDEPEGNDMVSDEFAVVLAGFLKTNDEDNKLLAPVG